MQLVITNYNASLTSLIQLLQIFTNKNFNVMATVGSKVAFPYTFLEKDSYGSSNGSFNECVKQIFLKGFHLIKLLIAL